MPDKNNVIDNLGWKTKVYLVIIALLLIFICIIKPKLIFLAILVYLILIIYSIWTDGKKKTEIFKHIQELTLDVNFLAKNALENNPFPIVILKNNGKILWKSDIFTKAFANIDIKNYLNDIVKEINQEINNGNKDNLIDKELCINDKIFKVSGKYVKFKENLKKKELEYMITLYFIDNTDFSNLQVKFDDKETCVGIITIDNYEETIQRISVDEKSKVMAEIEKNIYDWANQTKGLVIKTERETFIYVFEKKYLEELENNKFEILDTIKEVDLEGLTQLTFSIAISTEGETNYEKYKSALVLMDIALGRGGDQAVIKDNGKYLFFGGRTQELEKRTKVKARTISHALEELILASDNVIIMGHTNSDIDSLGSSLGLYRLVKNLNKDAYIVNNVAGISIEKFIEELKKDEEYQNIIINKSQAMSKINENSLLIVVDTHKKSYTEIPELLDKTNRIVIIDHHRKSTDFIDNPLLTFHEVYASSAAELVIEIIQYFDKEIELKPLEIEALYAGIMIDTKNFTFKTGVRTFEAAAFLRKYGVDIIKVKKWFQADLENYNIISDVVRNAEIINNSIGISLYNIIDKDVNLICAKAADELLTISNITASFVIGSNGDKVFISGRSIGDINVQIILEKLGGGGHISLAGAQLENLTLEEAKDELKNRINEYLYEIS